MFLSLAEPCESHCPPRPFLTLPRVCRGGKAGQAGEGWYRRVRCGCSPASCGAHRRG
jgi:hypothetical protein